jgi:oligopeptide/dipeptide ABC transporter ATP-binding protein
MSEQIAVMYLGKIVERGDAGELYRRPKHPYTKVLMACVPHQTSTRKTPLQTIEGTVPDARRLPRGCPFSARCSEFMLGVCDKSMPALTAVGDDHEVACFLHSDQAEDGVVVTARDVASGDG